jgi:hypothetical protein
MKGVPLDTLLSHPLSYPGLTGASHPLVSIRTRTLTGASLTPPSLYPYPYRSLTPSSLYPTGGPLEPLS